ncbi:MAG TPA: NADH:ubiquinone reductase (Na(+)-transporting) subunit C [Bacteroidales bacterium]|nr:NADH:ubiquinone reductase (Na(+)-transporting) subunit C [Bacteroidales bacterium]
MFSNRYIFIYSTIIVAIVAVALTLIAVGLKPYQDNNIRIEKMQNILKSINVVATPKNAEALYKKYIVKTFTLNAQMKPVDVDAFSIDLAKEVKKTDTSARLYPVYIACLANGDSSYIFPLRGQGLWGPVWGYVALKNDFNTVLGVMFDHKGETPGLGAEIATETFQAQFFGKQIFDEQGNYRSIRVLKGGVKPDDVHGVDGISGGTITSRGVDKMIFEGLKAYLPYINYRKKI